MKRIDYSQIASHLDGHNFSYSFGSSSVGDSQAIMIVCALRRVFLANFYFLITEGFKYGTRVLRVNFGQRCFS